jgi:hypothetical protein
VITSLWDGSLHQSRGGPRVMGARAVTGWCRTIIVALPSSTRWHVDAAAKGRNLVMRRPPRRKASLAVAALLVTIAAGLGGAGGAQAAATHAQKMRLTQTNRSCDGAVIGAPATRAFGLPSSARPHTDG